METYNILNKIKPNSSSFGYPYMKIQVDDNDSVENKITLLIKTFKKSKNTNSKQKKKGGFIIVYE